MRRKQPTTRTDAADRADALLRQTAQIAPDAVAPEDDTFRALVHRSLGPQPRLPVQRRAPVLALALAATALALLLPLAGIGRDARPPAQRRSAAATPAPVHRRGDQEKPSVAQALPFPLPAFPTDLLYAPTFPPAAESASLNVAVARRIAPGAKTAAAHKILPPRPLKAIWTVEIVRADERGLLLPGWAVAPDAEDQDRFSFTPAVCALPTQDRVITCAYRTGDPFQPPLCTFEEKQDQ